MQGNKANTKRVATRYVKAVRVIVLVVVVVVVIIINNITDQERDCKTKAKEKVNPKWK